MLNEVCLFFNGVLVAKLLVVTRLLGPYSSNLTKKFCLGHGWQIFYHNHALPVRYNFYIKLFSFKQQMAEFSTTEEAWKSSLDKEVKAWFPVLRCFFFCRVRIFSQTPCPDCLPSFLWMIPLCFFPCISKKRGWALVSLQVLGLVSQIVPQNRTQHHFTVFMDAFCYKIKT